MTSQVTTSFFTMTARGGKIMKKTIIENRWVKMVNDEIYQCRAIWHYLPNKAPKVFIAGYNPFPFFGNQGIKTSLSVFNKWMAENGWKQVSFVTLEHLHKTVEV